MGGRWDIYSDGWEMGYIQRWVGDGIYIAMGGRWDIYSDGWEMGYIQRWVGDGIYIAMGERWDIYSDGWKRSNNGRIKQSKAMEYGTRKASPDVLKQRNIIITITQETEM